MNGSWYPWGLGVNGNTAAQYITMWRKVVTAFRMAGASNVRWVWCPNVDQATMAQFYPGDDYVDWIALDGYNKGAVNGNTWITFQNMLISSYNQICAITTKPLMIAETASNETGGDKPQWIRDMFAMIPTAFPRIRAVIWYDLQRGRRLHRDGSGLDCRIAFSIRGGNGLTRQPSADALSGTIRTRDPLIKR